MQNRINVSQTFSKTLPRFTLFWGSSDYDFLIVLLTKAAKEMLVIADSGAARDQSANPFKTDLLEGVYL